MTGSATHFGSQGGGQFLGTGGWTFNAWEIITPGPRFYGSYGYNDWLFKGFSQNPARLDGKLIEMDVFSFRGRTDVPVLLDASMPWGSPQLPWQVLRPPTTAEGATGAGLPCCINRHSACVNALFLDWSVRKVGLKELWTLYWCADFNRSGPWTKAGSVKPEKWPKWMRNFKDY
jgi:hypothetical protein